MTEHAAHDTDPDSDIRSDGWWFPPRMLRLFVPVPDPLPLPDGWAYVFAGPAGQHNESRLAARGAVFVPGDDWLRTLITEAAQRRPDIIDSQDAVEETATYSQRYLKIIARHWQTTTAGGFLNHSEAAFQAYGKATNQEPVVADSNELIVNGSVFEIIAGLPAYGDSDNTYDPIEDALAFIRHIQHGLYVVRRLPAVPANRGLLVFPLPIAYGDTAVDATPKPVPVEKWEAGLWKEESADPWSTLRTKQLDNAELARLDHALGIRLVGETFDRFMYMKRESEIALRRRDDYSSSVVWSAAACEFLLNEVLESMLWEEGKRPEDAAVLLAGPDPKAPAPGIVARVKKHYKERLGGNWNLDGDGDIARWKRDVADQRNALVHGTKLPSREEADTALKCVDALVTFIGGRLVDRLKTYPRLTVRLIGLDGVQKRGRNTTRLKQIMNDQNEIDWNSTFGRWKTTFESQTDPPRSLPRDPTTTMHYVSGRHRRGYWVVLDSATGYACRVNVKSTDIAPKVRPILRAASELDAPSPGRAVITPIATPTPCTSGPEAWVEAYRLVPGLGVMVNGDDISDDEFTWRPSSD